MVWSGTRKGTTVVESSQWSSQPHVAEMPRQRAQRVASPFPAAVVGCIGLCVVALTSSGRLLVGRLSCTISDHIQTHVTLTTNELMYICSTGEPAPANVHAPVSPPQQRDPTAESTGYQDQKSATAQDRKGLVRDDSNTDGLGSDWGLQKDSTGRGAVDRMEQEFRDDIKARRDRGQHPSGVACAPLIAAKLYQDKKRNFNDGTALTNCVTGEPPDLPEAFQGIRWTHGPGKC